MTRRSWRIQVATHPGRVALLVAAALMLSVGVVNCSVPTGDGTGDDGSDKGIDPVFPANYLETFTEVRDCRFSSSHPGMIRVLVNDIGAAAYLNDENPLPVGSIVVKETFDGTTCEDSTELSLWSAMRKEAAGFDPDAADWHWQDVSPDRTVLIDTKTRCISCHRAEPCLARDFMCTTSILSGDENDSNGEQPAEPRWTLVHQELPSALLSVQVVSNGDVYAVGSDSLDSKGPYVLHFDGATWTRLITGAVGDLWWVHQVGPDEIWMCGSDRLILRFEPSTGIFTPVDAGDGTETLYGIWGLSTNDIWAVGGSVTAGGVVLRYDGVSWTEVDLPELPETERFLPLFKVWGVRADDLWLVGAAGRVLHHDGSDLALEQTDTGRTLFTVHGDAQGELIVAVGGAQSGEIRELIDGVWTNVTPQGAVQMNGVNIGSGNDAVAVGNAASTMRRGEDGWVTEDNGLSAINDLDFHAVWVDQAGNAWSVGGSLLIEPLDRGIMAFYGTGNPTGEIVNGP